MTGELAKIRVRKHSKSVRLLRYSSQNCHVSNSNALFKAYRCPSFDDFIKRAYELERYLTTCKERVKHVFSKNLYQLRKTLFDKLDPLNIPYSDDQKFFKNMALFDFKCRTPSCAIPITQVGSGSTFQDLYQLRPAWLNHQSFYAIPISQLWLSHLLMLLMG